MQLNPHDHAPALETEANAYGMRPCPDCDGEGNIRIGSGTPCSVLDPLAEDCPTCDGFGKMRL